MLQGLPERTKTFEILQRSNLQNGTTRVHFANGLFPASTWALSAKDTTSWEVQMKSLNDFAGYVWTSRPRPLVVQWRPSKWETLMWPSCDPEAMAWNPRNPELPFSQWSLWRLKNESWTSIFHRCERSKRVETLMEPRWPLMLQHYRQTCRTSRCGTMLEWFVDDDWSRRDIETSNKWMIQLSWIVVKATVDEAWDRHRCDM